MTRHPISKTNVIVFLLLEANPPIAKTNGVELVLLFQFLCIHTYIYKYTVDAIKQMLTLEKPILVTCINIREANVNLQTNIREANISYC